MDGQEIKRLITFNNQKIEEMLDPATFVLKPEIQELLNENQKLRQDCPHEFQNGICIYCGITKNSLK